MADRLTPERRSWLMSRVRGRDTKPEWILRSALHRLGYRYRLRRADLPGKPDLVFASRRVVVFVHGCFWHRHPHCPKTTMPKSNVRFWKEKFRGNVERDQRHYRNLRESGWRVVVVWECEIYERTVEVVERVADVLDSCSRGRKKRIPYSRSVDRSALLRLAEDKVQYRLRRECDE